MKCLNIKNKEVKAALDELTSVLGNEDAAYYVVSENESYAIDLAPNGEPSKLFSDLLSHFGGDREAAIKAKVKTFTEAFKTWFGESKIIDGNGEPLIVYHGGEAGIEVFDKLLRSSKSYLPTANVGYFFTDDAATAESYKTVNKLKTGKESLKYAVFLNIENPLYFNNVHEFRLFMTEKEYIGYNNDGDIISTRLIPTKNDGIYITKTNDLSDAKEIVAIHSDQIKSVDNTGVFSNADNRIMYAVQKENREYNNSFDKIFSNLFQIDTGIYDSRDVVAHIIKWAKPGYRLHKILSLVGNMPVKIKMEYDTSDYMYYDPSDDMVHINAAKLDLNSFDYNIESIAHELVHWYTANAYYNQETKEEVELAKLVDAAYEKYSKFYEGLETTKVLYGLTDQDEFMAELLTNSLFYNVLMDAAISYDNTGGLLNAIVSMLNKISQLITKTFGVNLGLLETESITELKEVESVLFDFVSMYNTEMESDVYDFTLDRLLQRLFFDRAMNESHKTLGRTLKAFDAYNFNTSAELDTRLSDMRDRLTTKLQSRYASIDIEDRAEKVRIKLAIKYQITNLQDNTIDTITNVINIISDLKLELLPIAHRVVNAYNDISKPLTNEDLISLDRNFFGFYCPTLEDIQAKLSGLSVYRDIVGKDNYDRLLADVKMCQTLLNDCSSYVKAMQVKNATNMLTKIGIAANSPTIYNYIALNTKDTGFEISTLTRLLGAGDKINDESLKALYKILLDAEDKTNHSTFNKATALMALLKKAGKKQNRLFEVDDNGKPTGYIIRDKNYGKFHNNYKAEIERIKKLLGLNPGELGLPENKDIRKLYNKLKNQWLSANCERKYTDEYYELFEELSQEATDAREIIQIKIRNLTDKVKNKDGVPEFERLTADDWAQLNRFYIEKKLLSSPYDVYGNLKEGVDADIAKELSDLNAKLAKGMKLTTNQAKFEKVRAAKLEGLSKEEYNAWLDRNTRIQYSDEFYELLSKVERSVYGKEYAAINDEKRAILNMFRDDKTGEVLKSLMSNIVLNKVNNLDQQLRQLRKKNKKAPKEGSVLFEDIAKIVPTEAFNNAYNEALEASMEDPMALEVFLMQHANTDKSGKHYPKSYYSKIVPKDDKYINRVPTSGFSELSSESAFYNSKYDHTNQEEYYQPKDAAGYNNKKAFSKLTPELLELRSALLDTMSESNDKLTNLTKTDKYKMPQISGSMYRFMKSNMGYVKGATTFIKDAVSTRNDDEGIHDKPEYAPDGTSLNFVPLYFVKDLEVPSSITADLVGSVLRYYKMSENFKLKTAIRGDVEIIKKFLAQRAYKGSNKGKIGLIADLFQSKKKAKVGTDTNIYKFAELFIAMNLYNVQADSLTVNIDNHNFKLFGKEINVKAREINFTKLLRGIKNLGTLRNLGLSMWIAGTGFFTASHNHLVLTLVGRYYNWHDAMNATKSIVYDLFKYGWRSVGNLNYKSKLMALMDYFETGGTIDSIYRDSNENAGLRTIGKHWAFGMYSLSDYLVKGTILNSVMYNYRNVNGEFICQEDYLNKYGNSASAKDAWKKYKSAYDSIEYVNGLIQMKNSDDDMAWEKARFRIGRTALTLGASADGTLTAMLKALFTTNVFGSMAMMHRQYLPLALQEKWTMDMQWDYTTQRYREGVLKTPLRIFKLIKKDERNISTLSKFMEYSTADAATKANMKLIAIEAVLVLSIYPILRTMLNDMADEDKKNFWLNLLAYIMMRTSFEVGAPYNFIDIARTVKNPTPLFSMLDNWGSVISYPMELAYNLITDKKGKNKKITRGAYKGDYPIEKALWQMTPFKSIIEALDLPSKRNYYDKQILGN